MSVCAEFTVIAVSFVRAAWRQITVFQTGKRRAYAPAEGTGRSKARARSSGTIPAKDRSRSCTTIAAGETPHLRRLGAGGRDDRQLRLVPDPGDQLHPHHQVREQSGAFGQHHVRPAVPEQRGRSRFLRRDRQIVPHQRRQHIAGPAPVPVLQPLVAERPVADPAVVDIALQLVWLAHPVGETELDGEILPQEEGGTQEFRTRQLVRVVHGFVGFFRQITSRPPGGSLPQTTRRWPAFPVRRLEPTQRVRHQGLMVIDCCVRRA